MQPTRDQCTTKRIVRQHKRVERQAAEYRQRRGLDEEDEEEEVDEAAVAVNGDAGVELNAAQQAELAAAAAARVDERHGHNVLQRLMDAHFTPAQLHAFQAYAHHLTL